MKKLLLKRFGKYQHIEIYYRSCNPLFDIQIAYFKDYKFLSGVSFSILRITFAYHNDRILPF